MFNSYPYPHRRKNPLTGSSVLVSPHRDKRPWLGKVHNKASRAKQSYDPSCYLCPGNKRVSGQINPSYVGSYSFTNDHRALLDDSSELESEHLLLTQERVTGTCRVFCFSGDHSKALRFLSQEELSEVFKSLGQEIKNLSKDYAWVQAFENKGEIMGCSNPHPHAQLWALSEVPDKVKTMDFSQKKYLDEYGKNLLEDYVNLELEKEERLVCLNEEWIAVIPWWAEWPFQTMVLPRFSVQQLFDLDHKQRLSLASLFTKLLTAYDNLFSCDFPYSMGWYGAPLHQKGSRHWLLHANFYPPLLRSATVQKFMVGYEMFVEPQRDLSPESAAEKLRRSLQ